MTPSTRTGTKPEIILQAGPWRASCAAGVCFAHVTTPAAPGVTSRCESLPKARAWYILRNLAVESDMSLRVLHVTPYAAGAWAYGGIPCIASTLTRALARRGHEVTVCTTDACSKARRLTAPDNRHSHFRPRPADESTTRLTTRVFPNVSNRLAYEWQFFTPIELGHFLGQHAGRFDIAHLHACRNLPGVIAARHLWRHGVPFVLAPNGTAPRIERRQAAKWLFDQVAGHAVMRRAARLVAVTHAERRQLLALGVPEEMIRVIPNPVDVDEFATPTVPGRFRERLDIGDAPLVVFLGKLTPRKNTDVLVKAFAQLRHTDARLVVAGNDMGAEGRTRAVAQDCGVSHRTVFTGLLRATDRLEVLADADAVVYPSSDEIFGLVPLEALLSGTPVVVADDSGCAEIIRATGGGQVTPLSDAVALARAIE